MIRILHLADLHLGAKPLFLGRKASDRSQDFLDTFIRTVDFALDPSHNIHAVIIAGDLFDHHNPSVEILSTALGQLRRLQQAKTPVVLAPGNHDALGYPNSVYALRASEIKNLAHFIDHPNVAHSVTLDINGTSAHFYGMAWDIHKSTPPFDSFKANEAPGFHIAVIHGTLGNVPFYDLHARDVPLQLTNLAGSGMDYIALGHIHAFHKYMAGEIPVVYPGTLEGIRFTKGEEGDRNLVVVEITEGHAPKLEFHPINQRTLKQESIDLDLESLETEDELAAHIREHYADPDSLLKINLHGTPPFIVDPSNLVSQLSGDFFWLDIQDKTHAFDAAIVQSWAGEKTIRGLFVQKLQAQREMETDPDQQAIIEQALKMAVQALNQTTRRRRR